jgi:hypothetical protein
MMRYPRQQNEVVGLVDHIINGVTEHPDKFPSCNAAILQAARDQFEQKAAALTDAQAQVAIIAAQKLEAFKKMQKDMKCQIKLGTVDNADTPENLTFIGWATKRPPSQIEIPAQPTNLKIMAQGNNGMLCLVWNKSRYSSEKPNGYGPVRSYIVERKFAARQQIEHSTSNTEHRTSNGNGWSDWQFVGSSFNNEIKLTKQPIGCKLEYQVRASNTSGESFPSNTISVVL